MTGSVSEEEQKSDEEEPRREPVFNLAGVVIAIIVLCTGIHLLRTYLLSPGADYRLLLHFAFLPIRYTGNYPLDIYAVVSPITYSFLHGSFAHLGVNMVALAAFGSPLANRIGTARFLLFWAAATLAAAFLHLFFYPQDAAPLVGASGAISGMWGAAARFDFRVDRRAEKPGFAGTILPLPMVFRSRMALVFIGAWFVTNIAVGITSGTGGEPEIAWIAHIGGFLFGLLLVPLFDRHPPGRKSA
ncbi:rhomboid family intramembrane serine protease [Chelativorans sp. AA-79]|uniref:rhomboid family intramembrane serine protease n=1 Tax=Chelativorans sp. AA-79 TaxID=3028735 RepID=UPI0023FA0921|nr:rhomboid family intramembrane serine protease [Chelativorans sp. AA-79]WEX07070.1 rhomboid family intramembrane serine protease [Chelativorans sp. AA-79]